MEQKIQSIYQGSLGAVRFSALRRTEICFPETRALSLKYVVSGAEHYEVGGKRYTINPGQMLLFSAGHSYVAYIDNNQLNEGFCIDLDPGFIERANFDFFGEAPLFRLDEEFTSVKIHQPSMEIRTQIQYLYRRRAGREPMVFEESLNDIMLQYLLLRKDFSERIKSVPAIKPAVKKEAFRKVLAAREFIHDHRTQPLHLEQLARAVGLSKFYLHRLFVQIFALTPSQYLERIRMEEALRLLKKRNRSITEISFALGYNDITYFSRRFKKFYGISPRQMLKEIR